MHLVRDRFPCYVSEVFEGIAPLLRNQLHRPIPLPIAALKIEYGEMRGDYVQCDHDGEMCSKRIPVKDSNQSRPGKRAKAVFVANTLSPTETKGSAVKGKYTSTRDPKRINP